MSIALYRAAFRELRPDRSSGHAKPHKACVLLAVIDLIERGQLTENKIYFDTALTEAFSERFERYKQGNDKDDASMPYFYLSSSAFWTLHPNAGQEAELTERLSARKHGGPGIIRKVIAYAQLDNDLYQLLQNPIHRAMLASELESTLVTRDQAFRAWCLSIGKSEKTISNYAQALKGSLSQWCSDITQQRVDLMDISSSHQLHEVHESLGRYDLFKERNSKGNGMYSAALNLYNRFIKDECELELEADIQELEQSYPDSTERESLVNARRGQGLFRARILAQWDNRCAVTGYQDTRFLLASHIKPWRTSDNRERLDRFNGFPLIPSLDKAFDIGFISFDSSGKILLSPQLETPETLGIFEDQKIAITPHHQDYLAFHRSERFAS